MTSLPDRPKRRAQRASSTFEPKPQPTIVHEDGGYSTLRPTKGWIRISGARLRAQQKMAQLLDHVLPYRKPKPPKVWRKPAPPAPSVETRQQRRHQHRGR